MKYIIVIDVIHLYYTVISNIIRLEIKVVFVVWVFFVVSFYNIEVNSYNCEFFMFFFRC